MKAKNKVVTNEYVEKAINEKVYRNNRIEERMREMIAEGTLIVDTSGEKAGQVNGLAVLESRGLQLPANRHELLLRHIQGTQEL